MNVLIVEDNRGDLVLLEQKLSSAPEMMLDSAGTLEEALDRLSQSRSFDLVLLDLSLPDSRGLDTFRTLHLAAPELAIVVLSGSDDEALAIRTVQEGAQDYLCKSALDPQLLLRAMRYAVERSRIRRTLAQERLLLNTLLEGVPESIYFKDASHRFTLVNRSLADVLGLSDPRDAIGRSDQDFFSPEHARAARRDEMEVMTTGEPLFGKVECEGALAGSNRWVLTNKLPLRDPDGHIVGTFGVSSDITELKEVEEALRGSEERYRKLLNSVTDYLYSVYMENGRPVATSHSEGCVAVTGYTKDDYRNDKGLWLRMVHPDDRDAVIHNFERMCDGGGAESIEHRIIQKSGAVRWVRNTPTPHYDSAGALVSYDSVVADITDRKEAELKLKTANVRLQDLLAELTRSHEALKSAQLELIQAEKMQSIGRLAAGIAHEVKNPLAILQLGLNCLSKQPLDPTSIGPVLEQMSDAVSRANSVITWLLEYAAAKALEMRECEIGPVINHAIECVRHLLLQDHIVVRVDLAPDLSPIRCDRLKLEQVLVNLLTNACHAMPAGGSITVSANMRKLQPGEVAQEAGDRSGARTRVGDTVLVIEIQDSGEGIPAEQIQRVFDPFFTTKPTGKGTGLGLSVARKIIDLHGGHLALHNGPDGGVTASVILPSSLKPKANDEYEETCVGRG